MKVIIIDKSDEIIRTCLIEDDELVEEYEEGANITRLEGNVYLGKVRNILPGMQSAFIDINEKRNAFIHINELLEKQDDKTGNKEVDFEKFKIKDFIKENDPLLVQVKKDEENEKGVIVTTNIKITGLYSVLLINTNIATISQKIEDNSERKRLLEIANELKGKKEKLGLIIRTSAEGIEKEEIKQDFERLKFIWNQIKERYEEDIKEKVFPDLIYENNDIEFKFLLGVINNNIDKIITNNKEIYEKLVNFTETMISKEIPIEFDDTREKIRDVYQLDSKIRELEKRKIWLKNGSFITIDKTEALTAIDVNSGKYTGSENESKEDTILKVNTEATKEIARQLRVRNISGIIIIDYINMNRDEDVKKVEKLLREELKKDRSKTQIVGFTKLNLLEMTRKKI